MKICMMRYEDVLRCRLEADRGRPQLGQEQQQGTKDIRIISGCQNCNKKQMQKQVQLLLKRIFHLWPTGGKSKEGCEEHQLRKES